jgi:PAS domain S-box-containing protein
MTGLSAVALCLAGICAYVGVYHLILYARTGGPKEGLAFSMACLAVAGYDACCTGLYNASSVAEAIPWQRGQTVALCLVAIFIIRFVSQLIEAANRPLDLVFFAYFLCQATVLLIDRSDLTWKQQPDIKALTLPWSRQFTLYEAAPGLLVYVQSLVGVFVCLYIVVSLIWAMRRRRGYGIPAILAGTVCLVAGVLSDTAVAVGLYKFPYVIEYAYLCLVLAVAYALAERTARLHADALRLTAAVENAWESIIITNTEGKIEYVNPHFERTTGWKREEAVGQRPSIISSGKHDRTFYDNLWHTLNEGRAWTGEFTNRKKTGALYREQAVIYPVRDERGRTVHYVAVQHDVSQEQALEAQLRQSQKMEAVGRLAAGVAHDFTNILVTLMNRAMMLKKGLPDGSDLRSKVDDMLHAIEKAGNLTAQLMAFAHQKPVAFQEENLARVVAGIETMLRRTITPGVDLEINTRDTGSIMADPAHLEQILIHLAINACDAMPGEGMLTIETGKVTLSESEAIQLTTTMPSQRPPGGGTYAMLTVSDSGIGMNRETLEHIFDPFFTTKKATLRSSGLGLSTVYGMVQQHHGYIMVHTHWGRGTTFSVFFPITASEEPPPPPPTPCQPGTKVLIVVSDPVVRSTLAYCLHKAHCKTLEAESVSEACRLPSDERRDVKAALVGVLRDSDTVEPGMTLAKAFPGAATVLVTGYPRRHLIRLGLIGERDAVLSAPISCVDLAIRLYAALNPSGT